MTEDNQRIFKLYTADEVEKVKKPPSCLYYGWDENSAQDGPRVFCSKPSSITRFIDQVKNKNRLYVLEVYPQQFSITITVAIDIEEGKQLHLDISINIQPKDYFITNTTNTNLKAVVNGISKFKDRGEVRVADIRKGLNNLFSIDRNLLNLISEIKNYLDDQELEIVCDDDNKKQIRVTTPYIKSESEKKTVVPPDTCNFVRFVNISCLSEYLQSSGSNEFVYKLKDSNKPIKIVLVKYINNSHYEYEKLDELRQLPTNPFSKSSATTFKFTSAHPQDVNYLNSLNAISKAVGGGFYINNADLWVVFFYKHRLDGLGSLGINVSADIWFEEETLKQIRQYENRHKKKLSTELSNNVICVTVESISALLKEALAEDIKRAKEKYTEDFLKVIGWHEADAIKEILLDRQISPKIARVCKWRNTNDQQQVYVIGHYNIIFGFDNMEVKK